MGQESVVADLGEAARQHVQEKPPDKLVGTNRELLFFVVVAAVPVAEPYAAVLDGNDPVVGDCHPVGVTAQILEHLLRPAEGLLGIGDPLLVP